MSAPGTSHWDIVIRILRYLKSAPGRGIMYSDCDHNCTAKFSDGYWHVVLSTEGQLYNIVSLLEGILCHERVKNKLLSLDQVRSQNIELLLILHVNFYGYKIF